MSSIRRFPRLARVTSKQVKLVQASVLTSSIRQLSNKCFNGLNRTLTFQKVSSINGVRFYSSKDFPSHNVIKMPALSPTMTSGNIGNWHKKVGDEITAGDVLVEIETDKAQMDFEFQEDGFIAKILVDSGAKDISINQPLAVLVENKEDIEKFSNYTLEDALSGEGEGSASTTTQEAAPSESKAQDEEANISTPQSNSTPSQNSSERIFASPLAKKLAEEKGINLADIKGTGPNNRIIKSDVESYTPAAKPSQAQVTYSPAPVTSTPTSTGAYTDIPLTNIRKVIATRLTESKQQIPHYYLTVESNIDSIMKLRQHLNNKADDKFKLSVNDFIAKASALAMKDVPEVNSAWHGDFIRQYHNVDISIATATPTGLITPIVKSVEGKGLSSISNEIKALAARARNNELKPHEYQGGTFTISNLGMFGVNNFTAIINPPQSCILAVGTAQSRVVLDASSEKGFKEANFLTVTLSCDHRVVDGAVGAKWLKAFKGYLENPLTMLL